MDSRLGNLLLIASAVILSFVTFMAGEIVIPFFGAVSRAKSLEGLRAIIPAPTLFVSDHRALVVVLLATVCLVALASVRRLPGQTLRCVAVGLSAQWLVVWVAAFCLCYDGFLGFSSMHHPQSFEFGQFLPCARGVFPISFILIVAPLVTACWPARRPADA